MILERLILIIITAGVEADEKGELPTDLKRGVLSEDGLWNLLTNNDELRVLVTQQNQ